MYRQNSAVQNDDKNINIDNPKTITDKIITHFKEIIEDELAQLVNLDEIEAEQQYHKSFCKRLTSQFRGRTDILNEIDSYIASDSSKPFALIGPSGSGKSSVMGKGIEQAIEKNPDAVIVYRFIGANAGSTNIISLLHSICAQIASAYDVELESLLEENQREKMFEMQVLSELFNKCLALATAKKPLQVFLDALDQLAETENAHSLYWLPKELNNHASIIVSALPELENALTDDTTVENLPQLPPAEAADILKLWLADSQRTLTEKQLDYILNQFATNGLPLYLRIAFEQGRHWKSFDPSPSLPADIENIIGSFLDGLKTEHTEELVSTAISYMLCGRDKGLTEDEILTLLHRDKEYWPFFLGNSHPAHRAEIEAVGQLPIVVWSRLFFDLEQFLTECDSQGERIICFYHRLFNEVAAKKYLENARKFHERIAEYFEQTPHFLDGKEMKQPSVRKCVEIVRQQLMSERWNKLEEILSDLSFIEAKVQKRMVYDLIKDYQEALNALPEYQDEKKKEQKRLDRLDKYTHDLIAYAKGENDQLDIIPSIRIWSDEEIDTECDRMANNPTRLDKIKIFFQFVNGQAHVFTKPWITPGIAIQQAYNSAKNGPVADSASELVEQITVCPMVLNTPHTQSFNPRPALQKMLEGHTNSVSSLAVTPDGRIAVSGSGGIHLKSIDSTFRVWDLKSGKCLRTLEGHTGSINAVSITPDGRRAVSSSSDKTLRIWDLDSGECSKMLKIRGVSAVTIMPDGRTAISGCMNKTLRILDLESGKCLKILKGHTGWINAVAVTPDGRKAVSAGGGDDRTLRVWDLESGKCSEKLEGHREGVEAVAVTPDGRRAVSTGRGWDHTLRVWDLESGTCLKTLEGHTAHVNAVAVTPDGRRAVSGAGHLDKTLRVWDLESGKCLRMLEGHTEEVNTVGVTPDGRMAVSGSNDKTLCVWDLESGECSRKSEGHKGNVKAVAITVTPDGRRAVSGSQDNTMRVWNLESGKCLKTLEGNMRDVNAVAITPDGRRAVSGGEDDAIRVWNLKTGQCTFVRHTRIPYAVAITPDGRMAVSGGEDDAIRIWDLEACKCSGTLKGNKWPVLAVAVTPDGRTAISGCMNKTLRILDLSSGKCLKILKGHTGWINAVAVTPDGRMAVSGSDDKTLRVWDLSSGKCSRKLEGHTDQVNAVGITPDGRMVISGAGRFHGDENTLRVWDLKSGECLLTCHQSTGVMAVSAVTPDGHFVSGTKGGIVNFLKLVNYRPGNPIITAIRYWLSGTAQQPDGRWNDILAVACPWCGIRLNIPKEAIGQICECSCGKEMKLNPFVCDNSDWLD